MSGTGPSTDWEALARHVTGESSPEESERIDAWLAGHPDQREILATLDNAMSRMADDLPSDLDIEGALQRVKARRSSFNKPAPKIHSGGPGQREAARPRWRVPFPAIAAAAALLGVGALGYGILRDRTVTQPGISAPRMLATGVGVRDSLRLPDGTLVILGPLSSVTVSNAYGETDRVVDIRGDAWFDVIHDNSRPFTVRAGEATIVDIGTKFMVRNDRGQAVSVSVTEGSVSMRAANDLAPDGVILKAGDNAVLEAGRVVTRPGTVGEDDLAWMSGRLVFRETAMSEVITSMHRWYGIELRVSDSSLLSRNITATFAGESPDRMLEVLRLVLGANIERRGDTAVVTPRDGSTRSR